MDHLGTVEGTAQLIAGGNDCGEVSFSIDVLRDRGMKHGQGTAHGAGVVPEALGDATLERKDGDPINIQITNVEIVGSVAQFVTNGPIPGF